jgi:hypothetical protein
MDSKHWEAQLMIQKAWVLDNRMPQAVASAAAEDWRSEEHRNVASGITTEKPDHLWNQVTYMQLCTCIFGSHDAPTMYSFF